MGKKPAGRFFRNFPLCLLKKHGSTWVWNNPKVSKQWQIFHIKIDALLGSLKFLQNIPRRFSCGIRLPSIFNREGHNLLSEITKMYMRMWGSQWKQQRDSAPFIAKRTWWTCRRKEWDFWVLWKTKNLRTKCIWPHPYQKFKSFKATNDLYNQRHYLSDTWTIYFLKNDD